jgi:hypothetical protein
MPSTMTFLPAANKSVATKSPKHIINSGAKPSWE